MSEFLTEFRELKPKYERLSENIATFLSDFLRDKDIPIFSVESRVKDEQSFLNKVSRKGYSNPIDEIEDIVGVRVICYYQEDIEAICEIVNSEFNVCSEENKLEQLNYDQFGYSSYHYIVKLKEEWLEHPVARGLNGLKAEIQIRTMLMHTWSAISHKLLYKQESDVEPQFKRKLNRLSALIELADEQFNAIKNEKIIFQRAISIPDGEFDASAELSSDSLIAMYKHFFSDRDISENDIPDLVSEIRFCNYSLAEFIDAYKRCESFLDDMEQYEFQDQEGIDMPAWAFSGVVRTILDLTCDEYFEKRNSSFPQLVLESRDKFRKFVK